MKVLVTGATGLIGNALCCKLTMAHEVRALCRHPAAARRQLGPAVEVVAMPSSGTEWVQAVEECDGVVNLAGESIAAGRWTGDRKKRIRDSRVETTRALVQAMGAAKRKPVVLVSGSAIGYYGACGDESLDESSPPGDDFLASVCIDWEREAKAAESLGVRVVYLRTGVVLGPEGGALAKMIPPFNLFVGGPVGSGRQWMSWIHLDDEIGLIELGLKDDGVRGPLNASAPDPRAMKDFCRTLGAALHRPSWLPVPGCALRAVLGEMADMLVTGQRVLPGVAQKRGYRFKFPTLEEALENLLGAGD